MKKLSAVLLVAAAALSVAVFSASAASKPTGKITASSVNMRAGAGTNTKALKSLSKGTKLYVLSGRKYNGSWYHVKLKDGLKGYVSKSYLKLTSNQLYISPKATVYAGYKTKYNSLLNTTKKSVKWTSSNSSVAKINSKGELTPLKAGKTTITAKAGTKTAKSAVTVKNATVKLSKTSAEVMTDDSFTLTATCKKSVSWSSSDSAVASVKNGVVTTKAVGTAKITAKSKSGSAVCTVKIKKREIILSASSTTFFAGGTAKINATGGKYAYQYTSSDENVLTVDSKGYVKGVAEGEATVTVTSGELKKSIKFKIKKSTETVNISSTTGEVKAGMTLYVKSTTKNVKWKSSDESIATVDGGFVTGVKKGTVIITAYTDKGESDCTVTVKPADPVRFVYTSENSALLNETVTFYAITDKKRTALKFKITDPEGKTSWLKSPSKTTSDGRYIWSQTKKLTTAGVHTVIAYTQTASDSTWATGEGGFAITFVNGSESRTACSNAERRVTTKLVNFIANYEGFLSKVTPDELVADAPTVGYGRVVYAGTTFYNGMTKDEAYAYLVKTVNESGYTSKVNQLIKDNKLYCNQNQFDALVDFSYNLGPYAITNHEELIGTLQNTYGKESYKNTGFISKLNVELKKDAKASSDTVKMLSPGTIVTLLSTDIYNSSWYNVKLSDGTKGYIKTNQLTKRNDDATKRNLKNVSVSDFKRFLAYHHASGTCYKGLLYRRVDELEMFCFNDYGNDGRYNYYGISYSCSSNPSFKL